MRKLSRFSLRLATVVAVAAAVSPNIAVSSSGVVDIRSGCDDDRGIPRPYGRAMSSNVVVVVGGSVAGLRTSSAVAGGKCAMANPLGRGRSVPVGTWPLVNPTAVVIALVTASAIIAVNVAGATDPTTEAGGVFMLNACGLAMPPVLVGCVVRPCVPTAAFSPSWYAFPTCAARQRQGDPVGASPVPSGAG